MRICPQGLCIQQPSNLDQPVLYSPWRSGGPGMVLVGEERSNRVRQPGDNYLAKTFGQTQLRNIKTFLGLHPSNKRKINSSPHFFSKNFPAPTCRHRPSHYNVLSQQTPTWRHSPAGKKKWRPITAWLPLFPLASAPTSHIPSVSFLTGRLLSPDP